MRPLIWFRSDLRTDDNRALHAACADADRGVVGVFAACPRQWHAHDWGNPKAEFVLRSAACLAERLKPLNIPLCVVNAPTFAALPRALLALARRHACDALYFNREYEVNEQRRDAAVAAEAKRAGLAVHTFDDQVILPPDAVRTGAGRYYTVFSPYRRAWLKRLAESDAARPVPAPRRQPQPVCPSDPLPERLPGFDLSRGRSDEWPTGERHALRQLDRFAAEPIAGYARQRDLPAAEGTSRLSPYLSAGVLSPRRALEAVLEAGRGRVPPERSGPGVWLSELIWREFYRHVLVGYPRVSRNRAFRPETERIAWRDDPDGLSAWEAGQTGFPIVDAGLRQMAATGWMHNRVRMIVAMFLVKDLLIDWRAGERHFMRSLVDADLASNNGGWQWSASTGTDAAPYFRIFNPWEQSRRYDPEGTYIRRWVPELRDLPAAALHDPRKLQAALDRPWGIQPVDDSQYPAPILDHAEARRRALAAYQAI